MNFVGGFMFDILQFADQLQDLIWENTELKKENAELKEQLATNKKYLDDAWKGSDAISGAWLGAVLSGKLAPTGKQD